MMRRRIPVWSGLPVVFLAGLLAGPAWSGHGHNESTPIYSHACGGREAETEASLRELVRLLKGRGAMAVGDRLRCAVQAHPKLATHLLIPLVATSNREASAVILPASIQVWLAGVARSRSRNPVCMSRMKPIPDCDPPIQTLIAHTPGKRKSM